MVKGGYQLIDLTNYSPFEIGETRELGDDVLANQILCNKLIILKINLNIRGSVRPIITTLSSIRDESSVELNSGFITTGLTNIELLLNLERMRVSIITTS